MRFNTLGEMFYKNAEIDPSRTIYMHKVDGQYKDVSYQELTDFVKSTAGGLASVGVKKGDKVALLSENRLNWAVVDYAVQSLGAILVPLYPSLLSDQIEYILKDSESVILICSTEDQYEKVKKIRGNCPDIKNYVIMDTAASSDQAMTLKDFLEKGSAFNAENPDYIEKSLSAIKADDLATIIYTSGTTGDPKGVLLTHRNFISNVEGGLEALSVSDQDVFLSFLPLCHVFERMAGHFLAYYTRSKIAYAESIDLVAQNMNEVHPTIMTSVPRLYEKIYARILENVENGPGVKRKIFYWAIGVGREYVLRIMNKQPIGGALQFKRNLAYKLVFSKLAEKVGGKLRFFISGGAPLSPEIAEFFGAAGIMIYEGYGLTETSPVIAVNSADKFRFGTVGPILNNVEVKIADDGEILTRGPHVMVGYYKKEADTKEAIDEEGWFHTGDIGIIEDGFLKITDRKKNIIVTSGGKNIAPAPIENELITNKYIEQVMIIGDKRKFCSAVIVPSFETLHDWAKQNNLSWENDKDLVSKEEIRQLIREQVEAVNMNLASYETIKNFILAPALFSIETGELTPSLKIKRKVVLEKFKDEIEEIYKV